MTAQTIPLDDALIADFDIEQPNEFQIESDEAAQWASRKLRQANAVIADAKQQMTRELQRIDTWYEDATRSARSSAQYFESLLKFWHERAFREATEDRPAKITIPLVGATLKSVGSKESIEYTDEAAFIAFAAKHLPADVVKTTQVIVKSEAKKILEIVGDQVVTPDGEVVPGTAVNPATRSFSVKVNI